MKPSVVSYNRHDWDGRTRFTCSSFVRNFGTSPKNNGRIMPLILVIIGNIEWGCNIVLEGMASYWPRFCDELRTRFE